jgi:hypothetical protein
MKINMKTLALGIAMAAAAWGVTTAEAATFLLTFTQSGTPSNGCCGPFDVSATLQATANGGNYDVTGIAGSVTQNGTPFVITGLLAPPNDPGGFFGFDNIIFANSGFAPFTLDSGGIGFVAAGIFDFYLSDPAATFNVWGNGGTSATLGTTASYDVNTPFNGIYSITAIPSAASGVPEPSTWTMMILGFAGVGYSAYRRKSKPTLTTA